jgi:hypothetical protein
MNAALTAAGTKEASIGRTAPREGHHAATRSVLILLPVLADAELVALGVVHHDEIDRVQRVVVSCPALDAGAQEACRVVSGSAGGAGW